MGGCDGALRAAGRSGKAYGWPVAGGTVDSGPSGLNMIKSCGSNVSDPGERQDHREARQQAEVTVGTKFENTSTQKPAMIVKFV